MIDGKAVAAEVRERVRREVQELAAAQRRPRPGLATVLVGDDPASHVYVGNKRKQTEEVGMRSVHHGLEASASQEELLALIERVERRRRRWTGSSSSFPCPARSTRTR